jgi:hypothetical protein
MPIAAVGGPCGSAKNGASLPQHTTTALRICYSAQVLRRWIGFDLTSPFLSINWVRSRPGFHTPGRVLRWSSLFAPSCAGPSPCPKPCGFCSLALGQCDTRGVRAVPPRDHRDPGPGSVCPLQNGHHRPTGTGRAASCPSTPGVGSCNEDLVTLRRRR